MNSTLPTDLHTMLADNGDPTPFADTIAILEAHYYTPGELALWLQSPQPLLEDKTPLALLAQGRADELLMVIRRMDEGAYI